MGVFLAVISKKGNSIKDRICKILEEEVLEQSFHFIHTARDVYFTAQEEGCLINFASPMPLFLPQEKQFFQNKTGACALHGSIVEQKGELADIPILGAGDLLKILSAGDDAWFKDHYTGDFAAVSLSVKGELTAVCDVLSFQHIYYSENSDFVYVSNRQRMIRSVMENPQIDLEALVSLCSVETVSGTETLLKNVKRLEYNSRLLYSREKGLRLEGDPFFFAQEIPDLDYGKLVAASAADCVNRLKAALTDVDRIDFPLTGGRDSRANLALLLSAGQKEKLRIYTGGYPNHPDVMVAKAICEHYGIPHTLKNRARREFTDEEILLRVMGTVFQSDGCLGAWDSQRYFAQNKTIYLPGHASAAFKCYLDYDVQTWEDAATVRRLPISRAVFVKPEYRRMVQGKINAHMEACQKRGLSPQVGADSYKLMERMANWHGYLNGQNDYFFNELQLLDHKDLVHVAYAGGLENRKCLRVHYEIYRSVDPWLVEMPFAVKGWKPGLAKCVNDGLNLAAAPVPLPKGMPFYGSWQLKLNKSSGLRLKIWDIVSSFDGSDFWQCFDRQAIERQILGKQLESKDLMMTWNFIGAFFFYHGIELPLKVQKLNELHEEKGLFETTGGRRGCVLNYRPHGGDADRENPEFSNIPQICADSAALSCQDPADAGKYHMPIADEVLNVLPVCGWDDLSGETDAAEYVKKLGKPGYLVFIGGRDNAPSIKDQNLLKALENLGLTREFFENGRGSYLAIVDGGKALEEQYDTENSLRLKGETGGMEYLLYSGNFLHGNDGYLMIDETYYRAFFKGYVIVTYDKVRKCIADYVCLDGNAAYKLKRKNEEAACINEGDKLRNSTSWRVGHKLTGMIPRKLKKMIKDR